MKIEIVTGCAECDFMSYVDTKAAYLCSITEESCWFDYIPSEVPKECPLRKQPICHVLKIEESK